MTDDNQSPEHDHHPENAMCERCEWEQYQAGLLIDAHARDGESRLQTTKRLLVELAAYRRLVESMGLK